MDRIILERIDSSDQGTFGVLTFGDYSFYTGELPWRDNRNDISCIPCGIYQCIWSFSNRFQRNMYEVLNVSDRTGIRIHAANFMGDSSVGFRKQLNGCISLGEKLADMAGQKAVIISKPAVSKFEMLMDKKPFILEIRNGIY